MLLKYYTKKNKQNINTLFIIQILYQTFLLNFYEVPQMYSKLFYYYHYDNNIT